MFKMLKYNPNYFSIHKAKNESNFTLSNKGIDGGLQTCRLKLSLQEFGDQYKQQRQTLT